MKWYTTFLLLIVALSGCDSEESANSEMSDKDESTTVATTETPPVVVDAANGGTAVVPPPPAIPGPPGPPALPPPPPAPSAGEPSATGNGLEIDGDYKLVQAVVGVGKHGRYESNDYISTVVSARFRAAQTIEFAKIPRAMQMYKAESRGQKGPRSHEEFMKKVIEANLIQLPELPDGDLYRYVPEKETLYVARPKQ